MDNRNLAGPNAAGVSKNLIPDWLDHTANADTNNTDTIGTAAETFPGPNAVGMVTDTGS